MSRLNRFLPVALAAAGLAASPALAQITAPGLVKGINGAPHGNPFVAAAVTAGDLAELPDGPNFTTSPSSNGTGTNIFASASGTPYGIDGLGDQNGNQVLVITQQGFSANDGAGFTLSVANGENGDGTVQPANTGILDDMANDIVFGDPSTDAAADPVFAAIGNASGRLENGNVVRFSTWFQSDPLAPITVEPQIAPILKLEFHRDALGGVADFTGGIAQPGFGSRIFDTDQNGVAISDPDQRARVIDVDGNGTWSFGSTTDALASPGTWVQVVHTYTVDDTLWDIVDSLQVEGVEDVEEIRGALFLGDFAGTNLGGPGNLLVDNALIEIFADTAAEAASDVLVSNPSPVLDEGPTFLLGDADGDGDVDGDDLIAVQTEFGATGMSPLLGDADGDGDVDGDDLIAVQTEFGNTLSVAVPEPTTVALAALAAAGLLAARRNG